MITHKGKAIFENKITFPLKYQSNCLNSKSALLQVEQIHTHYRKKIFNLIFANYGYY